MMENIEEISSSDEDLYDDNDELVAWRGSGRYFGNTDEADEEEIICFNCHEKGHISADCKLLICELCDERGHTSRSCSKGQKCSKCGAIGHLKAACHNQARLVNCTRCKAKTHTELNCPFIWRQYVLAKRSESQLRYPTDIACYNCASVWHFGDQCPKERPVFLRYIEPSAFSGFNMARSFFGRYEADMEKVGHKMPRKGD